MRKIMTTTSKYLLWFAQEHVNFRHAEIQSILKLHDIKMNCLEGLNTDKPYWIVEFDNQDDPFKLASRSVSLRSILEIWASSESVSKLHTDVQTYIKNNHENTKHMFESTTSFKITVETYNKHFTQKEKVAKIETFDYLPVKGPANLKTPDVQWWYIEYYGLDPINVPDRPLCSVFGKWIVDGQRSLISELSLKTRKFIGNTSMDPQLALLMANQALAKPGQFVFDPFVGTGSLLVSAAKFGAYVMGCDIDFLTLHGKTKPSRINQKKREDDESIKTNLKQYNCETLYIDVMVTDFSSPYFTKDMQFDSIITDPPYGIREATETVISKTMTRKKKKEIIDGPHYPSTSHYNIYDLYIDLLCFSAKHLRLNGRLVCWIPYIRQEYNDGSIPQNEHLKVIANSEQLLNSMTSRRLITYEKISEPPHDFIRNSEKVQTDDFRIKFYSCNQETRTERRLRRAEFKKIGREEALKRGKILKY